MTSTTPTQVSYNHEDRQWDGRFNVQGEQDLIRLVNGIKSEHARGKFKYILISGVEIGTRPYQDDYQIKHVHVAAIFHNRASKRSILTNWNVREGNGYYLVPRNRDLPYSGWRNHHVKTFSKVDKETTILFEEGELPADLKAKATERSSEEKKRKLDDILIEMRGLIEENNDEQAFKKFPRTYLQYGEKLKSMVKQTNKQLPNNGGEPHIWLHGFPGTGKTAIMKFVYPNYYKKDLQNRFFDLYNDTIHTHIMLEDIDHQNVEKLGVQFLKTLCDEAGFPIDQKYKTPQLTRASILVTSNYTIDNIVPEGKGVDETKMALHRRFWSIRIDQLYRFLGLKLLSKYERDQLKASGNEDTSKIFMTWDYMSDSPRGKPLEDPAHYRKLIKEAYYNL